MGDKIRPIPPAPSAEESPLEPSETDFVPPVPGETDDVELPALEAVTASEAQPAVKTRASLADRLQDLKQGKKEQRAAFLGKAARLAARHPEDELSLRDLSGLRDSLIIWRFEEVDIEGEPWVQARRIVWSHPRWDKRLERYGESGRRTVGRNEDGNIVMLARTAFTGSDLKTLFQIEKANLTAKPAPEPRPIPLEKPSTPPTEEPEPAEEPAAVEEPAARNEPEQPKPRRRSAKPKKRPAAAKPEHIETPSGLRLTAEEKTALEHLTAPAETTEGYEQSGEKGTSLITAACERNKLSREDLLTKALEDGLIDLAPLEERGTPKLKTEQEHMARLLFGLDGFDERVKRLSPAGLEGVRELYEALGVQPDQHALAFLIVKHAGYLDD